MKNNTIQITPTIIGVVDNYKYNFNVIGNVIEYLESLPQNKHSSWGEFVLPIGRYKIHGTCTLPELEFDFEVDESWVEHARYSCLDYSILPLGTKFGLTKEESFRTRIQKAISDADFLLVNPHGNKYDYEERSYYSAEANNKNKKLLKKWQESESKVLRGKLLIIEKI